MAFITFILCCGTVLLLHIKSLDPLTISICELSHKASCFPKPSKFVRLTSRSVIIFISSSTRSQFRIICCSSKPCTNFQICAVSCIQTSVVYWLFSLSKRKEMYTACSVDPLKDVAFVRLCNSLVCYR